jgi:hypothetical protein
LRADVAASDEDVNLARLAGLEGFKPGQVVDTEARDPGQVFRERGRMLVLSDGRVPLGLGRNYACRPGEALEMTGADALLSLLGVQSALALTRSSR